MHPHIQQWLEEQQQKVDSQSRHQSHLQKGDSLIERYHIDAAFSALIDALMEYTYSEESYEVALAQGCFGNHGEVLLGEDNPSDIILKPAPDYLMDDDDDEYDDDDDDRHFEYMRKVEEELKQILAPLGWKPIAREDANGDTVSFSIEPIALPPTTDEMEVEEADGTCPICGKSFTECSHFQSLDD